MKAVKIYKEMIALVVINDEDIINDVARQMAEMISGMYYVKAYSEGAQLKLKKDEDDE